MEVLFKKPLEWLIKCGWLFIMWVALTQINYIYQGSYKKADPNLPKTKTKAACGKIIPNAVWLSNNHDDSVDKLELRVRHSTTGMWGGRDWCMVIAGQDNKPRHVFVPDFQKGWWKEIPAHNY